MQIQIQILSVAVETKSGKGGKSYQMAEVAYKDLGQGKVASKKLMSFTNPSIFKTAVDSKAGEVYDVELVKGEQYWDWTKMSIASAAASNAASTSTTGKSAFVPSTKSTYETPEERAKKQVYIVKQSSLSNAITCLSVGNKSNLDPDKVIELAQQFTDWVFAKKEGVQALIDTPNDLDIDGDDISF